MTNHVSDDEVNPKGMPNSDRHRSETAVYQPTDEHQTEAAKQAVEQEVAKKTRPELNLRVRRKGIIH